MDFMLSYITEIARENDNHLPFRSLPIDWWLIDKKMQLQCIRNGVKTLLDQSTDKTLEVLCSPAPVDSLKPGDTYIDHYLIGPRELTVILIKNFSNSFCALASTALMLKSGELVQTLCSHTIWLASVSKYSVVDVTYAVLHNFLENIVMHLIKIVRLLLGMLLKCFNRHYCILIS